jgi:hypothetical protein
MPAAAAFLLDVALLVAFAAIGRQRHGESGALGQTLVVAAPFVIGWLVAVVALRLDRTPLALRRATAAWAIGMPLALLLRGTLFGRGVPADFCVVALAFTALFLLGWRAVAVRVLGVGGAERT